MKKYGKLLFGTLFLVLFGITAAGCAAADGLNAFQRMVNQSVEAADTLDDVEAEDMTESVGTLAEPLAFSLMEAEMTNAEKIAALRQARTAIRSTHDLIVAQRLSLKIAFGDLKLSITAFREAGLTLSDAEKTQLDLLKAELRTINETLRGTIGKAFARMRDLRGQYTLENIDMLLQTHQEVLAILEIRLENLQRANAILAEVLVMLALEAE
jgi:hypothetical protein